MDNDSSSTAAGAAILAFGLAYAVFICVIIALMIWIYWRIFTKAGYNGALALLNLIPGVGSLIVILILAFGQWPIENELAAYRAGRTPVPGGGMPMGGGGAPIGGPPMTPP